MSVSCPKCGAVASYGREIGHRSNCPTLDEGGLRTRCKTFYQSMQANAMLRQGSPVDDLMAFVVAETGRTADIRLEESLPLCLYFASDEDRDEFVALVRQAKPGMVMKRLP